VNQVENPKDDLMADFAAIITFFCRQLYGMKKANQKKRILEQLKKTRDRDQAN